jgi:hypothetical protein
VQNLNEEEVLGRFVPVALISSRIVVKSIKISRIFLFVAGILTPLEKPLSAQTVPSVATPTRTPGTSVAAALGNLGEVEVSGRLSRSELRVRETVRFWLTIRNRSGAIIQEVILSPESFPGFAVTSRCWRPVSGVSCVSAVFANSAVPLASASEAAKQAVPLTPSGALARLELDRIITKLEPGQTLSIWADLRAEHRQEKGAISAVVSFQNQIGVGSQVEVPLGEITVRNFWDMLSSLFWPSFGGILGVIAGYILKRWQDQRAQKTETWNKMLPESHRLAMSYYAPIESSARMFIEYTKRYKKNEDNSPPTKARQLLRQSFYWWMIFSYRYRRMTHEAGAFYFKDRVGEELTVACFQECESRYHKRDEIRVRNYRRTREAMDPNETLDSFLNKLDARMDTITFFKDEWQHLESWVQSDDCEEALSYLEGFRSVLYYELNRPYEFWYGWTDPIGLDSNTERLLANVAAVIEQGNLPNFSKRTRKYLKQAKQLRRKG